jgi:hypothetical protein
MSPDHNPPWDDAPSKPYFSVGAGSLAAFLWKSRDEQSAWQYEFNLFRVNGNGEVSQLLTPADLLYVVKLAQVLAQLIAEDDGLPLRDQRPLAELAEDLGNWLQRAQGGTDLKDQSPESLRCPARRKKGHHS